MGGKRGKTVDETKERQIVEALKQGSDAQAVADKFGVSRSKIYEIAKKHNIKLRYKREKPPVFGGHPGTEEGQPGPEEGTPEYEHHQEMLSLVRRWRKELGVLLYRHPVMADDYREKALHSSVDPTEESPNLFWDNSGEALVVRLPYEVDTDGDIERARENLSQHLVASGDPDLLEQMEEWRKGASIEVCARASLLGTIELRLKEGFAYHQDMDSLEADLKKWYISTIAASWVDYADGRLDYGDIEGPDETGVYEVRYGKFIIIRASGLDRVKALLAIHKVMMDASETMVGALVSSIASYRKDKGLFASRTRAIQKFLDSLLEGQCIPGRCRACP